MGLTVVVTTVLWGMREGLVGASVMQAQHRRRQDGDMILIAGSLPDGIAHSIIPIRILRLHLNDVFAVGMRYDLHHSCQMNDSNRRETNHILPNLRSLNLGLILLTHLFFDELVVYYFWMGDLISTRKDVHSLGLQADFLLLPRLFLTGNSGCKTSSLVGARTWASNATNQGNQLGLVFRLLGH